MDSYIEPQQFAGISGDGVYVITDVGSKLDKYYDVKGHHDWDYMHGAARCDTEMRSDKAPASVTFLNEITNIVGKGNNFINYGMEYDRFFKV